MELINLLFYIPLSVLVIVVTLKMYGNKKVWNEMTEQTNKDIERAVRNGVIKALLTMFCIVVVGGYAYIYISAQKGKDLLDIAIEKTREQAIENTEI